MLRAPADRFYIRACTPTLDLGVVKELHLAICLISFQLSPWNDNQARTCKTLGVFIKSRSISSTHTIMQMLQSVCSNIRSTQPNHEYGISEYNNIIVQAHMHVTWSTTCMLHVLVNVFNADCRNCLSTCNLSASTLHLQRHVWSQLSTCMHFFSNSTLAKTLHSLWTTSTYSTLMI